MPDPASLTKNYGAQAQSTIVRPLSLPQGSGTTVNGQPYNPASAPWLIDPNNAYSNRPPGSTADYDPFEHLQYLQGNEPIGPEYHPGYDPLNMARGSTVDTELSGLGNDQQGLDQFRAEATRQGPSAWAGRANAQQDLATRGALNNATKSAAGQTAGADSRLAMRGGESSGARERVARAGATNALDMTQGVRTTDEQNRMQIGMNDEQNRISQLGQLPGMENANTASQLSLVNESQMAHQQDALNMATESAARNTFNQGKNQTQLAAWGAKNVGDATAASGKGGG